MGATETRQNEVKEKETEEKLEEGKDQKRDSGREGKRLKEKTRRQRGRMRQRQRESKIHAEGQEMEEPPQTSARHRELRTPQGAGDRQRDWHTQRPAETVGEGEKHSETGEGRRRH